MWAVSVYAFGENRILKVQILAGALLLVQSKSWIEIQKKIFNEWCLIFVCSLLLSIWFFLFNLLFGNVCVLLLFVPLVKMGYRRFRFQRSNATTTVRKWNLKKNLKWVFFWFSSSAFKYRPIYFQQMHWKFYWCFWKARNCDGCIMAGIPIV